MSEMYNSVYYHSILGKRPCTAFQGINVAASIQMYESYIRANVCAGQNCKLCLTTHGRLPGDTTVILNILWNFNFMTHNQKHIVLHSICKGGGDFYLRSPGLVALVYLKFMQDYYY